MVKHNELGVLIGQATGDTMASYGDYLQFRMPNSQLNCMVSCKYYELPGTTQENATQGVKPDYPVVSLLEDAWEHRDRALEFAYELCENGPDDS